MRILFVILFLCFAFCANAQIEKFVFVGINAGAPIPSKMVTGSSGTLGINPCIGFELKKKIYKRISLAAGLFLEQKSATYFSPIQMKYIVIGGDSLDGFKGNVRGKMKIRYANIPITCSFPIGKKWLLQTGVYLAVKLHGEHKGTITDGKAGFNFGFAIADSSFDESKNIKPLDAGVRLETSYTINSSWNLQYAVSYGLLSVTKPNENFSQKLHHLSNYINLKYRIKPKHS